MLLLTRPDETRCWCNGDKTGDSTRAKTDSGPFLLKAIIPEHPCDTTHTSSQVGDDAGLRSAEIGGERRSAIETEPPEPEEYRAQDDIARVVRLVSKGFCTPTPTLAEVERDGET